MSQSALSGIKVVELATMYSGPYCGKLLADLGAEVIKVEPPEGDPARIEGPFPEDEPHPEKSALFLYLNTSKRGVTLDLKNRPIWRPSRSCSAGPTSLSTTIAPITCRTSVWTGRPSGNSIPVWFTPRSPLTASTGPRALRMRVN